MTATRKEPQRLEDEAFRTDRLMAEHPPDFHHEHKRAIFERIGGIERAGSGELRYTRWREAELPETWTSGQGLAVDSRRGVFIYEGFDAEPGWTQWHLNFADANLFGYYGGPLLAQDELQVLEHPVLGSLRRALPAHGCTPRTTEDGIATPVLVEGAERRLELNTTPNPAAGRPQGIYGNRFAAADREAVLSAVRPIDPPTRSHVLAIEAPACGHGTYDHETIRRILATAYTGFRAAQLRTQEVSPKNRVALHTGFWGCGAYGGNRVLIPALQLIAAELAGVDRLVFYAFDDAGETDFERSRALVDELAAAGPTALDRLIANMAERSFAWGVSDGN